MTQRIAAILAQFVLLLLVIATTTTTTIISSVRADPACWPNVNGFEIVWAVDKSSMIQTTLGVPRGDRGLPITPWNAGYNGASVNVYGGKGLMPHVRGGNISVNGGVPQDGDLAAHLAAYDTHFAAMVTNASWDGYCLLDYEWWRLEWNATQPTVRYWSINVASLDEAKAKRDFEAAAFEFLLATVNKTREMRPNCKIGHYGYPQNYLPHIPTVQFNNWCSWNPGTCWWTSYSKDHQPRPQPPGSVEIKKQMNDDILLPFLDHLDVITPSLYLGILEAETTPEVTEAYINTTIQESRRLAELVYHRRLARNASTAVRPKVMPYTWFVYNNFWQVPGPTARQFLTAADAKRQFELPMWNGADGIIIWGAIDDSPTYAATSYGSVPLQNYMDTVLNPLFDEMLCAHWPPPPSTTNTETEEIPSSVSATVPPPGDEELSSTTKLDDDLSSKTKRLTATQEEAVDRSSSDGLVEGLGHQLSSDRVSDGVVGSTKIPSTQESSGGTLAAPSLSSAKGLDHQSSSSSLSVNAQVTSQGNIDGDELVVDSPAAAAKASASAPLSPAAQTGISLGVVLIVVGVTAGVAFGCWKVHQSRKKKSEEGRKNPQEEYIEKGDPSSYGVQADDNDDGLSLASGQAPISKAATTVGGDCPEEEEEEVKYLSVSPQECSLFDSSNHRTTTTSAV